MTDKHEGGASAPGIPEIRMFLTDCDGCLTDGGMYYGESGEELKKFNAQDGMGFKLLRERGILCGVITGEKRELNARRAKKLRLDILEQGVQDKLSVVSALCGKRGIPLGNVAYVGDDVNDLAVVKAVGFGCSVQNGVEAVKSAAKYVSRARGGDGAVREIIDLLLN